MKIKKLFVGLVALSAAVMATACSSNSSSSGKGNSDPKELNFEFVPSVQVNKVDSKTITRGITKRIRDPRSCYCYYKLRWSSYCNAIEKS